MTAIAGAFLSTDVEKLGSSCPYCASLMNEERCPSCGYICRRCGTPSKEIPCPQCGHGSSFIQGYSPTGSPAPAQAPELSDVQRILGRMPSRREFNMVRGMLDRNKERIHKLAELLCDRFSAPLNQELIEARALQVRSKAAKNGSALTHAECVVFAFMEAAKQTGMVEAAMQAMAEAQLLDSNLRLGLSRLKLSPLKFIVEVSGSFETDPVLTVDGEPRSCRTVLLDARSHGRTHLLLWRPLLADCLGPDFGIVARRVSAFIEDGQGRVPLKIAWKDSPGDKSDNIQVVMDPRRFFYGFTSRKEIEVDIGVMSSVPLDSEANLMLKKIGKRLDSLTITRMVFRMAGSSTPSGAVWAMARFILDEQVNAGIAVTPRKKAAAAIIAADMRNFARLGVGDKARLAFGVGKMPLASKDAAYTCVRGLIVPSEFSAVMRMDWTDALSLAVKF